MCSSKWLLIGLSLASLVSLFCVPAGAEEPSPDGEVIPVPMLRYVLASPRACILGTNSANYAPAGAENFARYVGTLRIPVGARVIFCLSRNLEGVWYAGAYGRIGTSLVLQIRDPRIDPAVAPDYENAEWITIGKDGARDVRRGPSIGHARVAVPYTFRHAGEFLLRGIIRTEAQPLPLEPTTDAQLPPAAVDEDVVYVRVKVFDLPILLPEPGETAPEPDAVDNLPMPQDMDQGELEALNADLNGDGQVDWKDFNMFANQWGKAVPPLYDADQ